MKRREAVIVTPLKLEPRDFDSLKATVLAFLKRSSMSEVHDIKSQIDPTILGGFKVIVGSVVIDMSLERIIDEDTKG